MDQAFECISIDTVGGCNYYNSSKKYLHLIIYHSNRYDWAFPSKSVSTEFYVIVKSKSLKILIVI